MQNSTLIWDEKHTPISRYFNDVYFNTDGAIDERTYVFINGNKLSERFLQHKQPIFTVGETGFGTGLSFLILWQTFLGFRKQHPDHILKKLQFFSVEKYPLTQSEMIKIHESVIHDQALKLLAKQLQQQLVNTTCLFNNVSLSILYNDVSHFPEFLAKQNIMIDAWFFDGFSPSKNPDMWSESLFKACYQLTSLGGTFATYSAGGFVRRNLISSGFIVNKCQGFGVKREMLLGYKNEITSPKK
ncbi:hypothetical protein A9G11_06705 [Gilliamella sp. wkB108]|uniref:tRNA (5-methylaminomethyl-2-thiouridine)(34)-methyltransferase MnmD n=1 Tax=Gilliamella sp. wkB108 TaxID=3120256 RepID=UPI00080DF4FE|nr:tRNA (5-methylaminomethyl-2-thiouridine)(34)-methyltransferase MnmD [Gilliamella apicola]OCG22856.1 hypothetical protein A9G11_06705 [Gilliamella apicola]